jgi:predicted RNA-binding protein with PIN domain
MRYLIDAYNVLHLVHRLPDRHAVVNTTDLCRLIERSQMGRATVVCDGRPKPDEDPSAMGESVRMIHSGASQDADTVIEKMLEEDPGARDMTVVSNDRRIQAAAKRRGAASMASETFLNRLAEALDSQRSNTRSNRPELGDTDHWMRKFELDTEANPIQPSDPSTSDTDQWMREFGYLEGESDSNDQS